MGRLPAIYEKKGRPWKSDRELVFEYQNAKDLDVWKSAAYELWDKYARVISIGKRELVELCKRHGFKMWDVIEEYDALFWEKFLNQLYGIRLDDVAHLPNWSMYIRVLGYLKAMNRDQVKAYIKWEKNREDIIETGDSPEGYASNLDKQIAKEPASSIDDIYHQNLNKKIFWESIDTLKNSISESQKIMLNMKIKGKFNCEIQSKLKITPQQYTNDMQILKFQLGQIITKIAKKNGLNDYNYQTLCNELQ
jgi:hypothetical protein